MTARSIGSPTISFGLVSIPTKLYTTNETSNDISFNNLHDADGARLKQQYLCTKCNEVVDKEHTVKGYEHAPGQYVTFTLDEIDALDAVATDRIEIKEFVFDVDPIYLDKVCYLAPDKGSERAFQLLAHALTSAGRHAIATYSARGKQHVVALSPRTGSVLLLQYLRYQHEVKPITEVPSHGIDVHVAPAELRMAKQLIEQMTTDRLGVGLDLSRYSDEVHARMRTLIDIKVAGGEIVVAPSAAPATPVDMMEALRASLATPARSRKARAAAVSRKAKPASSSKRAAAR